MLKNQSCYLHEQIFKNIELQFDQKNQCFVFQYIFCPTKYPLLKTQIRLKINFMVSFYIFVHQKLDPLLITKILF